jgi:hypothetical protein
MGTPYSKKIYLEAQGTIEDQDLHVVPILKIYFNKRKSSKT